MTDTLREEIARAILDDLDESERPVGWQESAKLADRILAIPRIANALKLTVVKTMGE
jgi:hypothetical protein